MTCAIPRPSRRQVLVRLSSATIAAASALCPGAPAWRRRTAPRSASWSGSRPEERSIRCARARRAAQRRPRRHRHRRQPPRRRRPARGAGAQASGARRPHLAAQPRPHDGHAAAHDQDAGIPAARRLCAGCAGRAIPRRPRRFGAGAGALARRVLRLGEGERVAGNVGVPAPGSIPQFLVHQMAQQSKTALVSVPYRGSAPMVQELMGGRSLRTTALGDFVEPHLAGKLRVIAVLGPRRFPGLPDVPTFAEQGPRSTGNTGSACSRRQRRPPPRSSA